MYACICNAFSDKVVDEAIDQGARTVGQVFQHAGCKPQCGRCVDFLRTDIAERMIARGIDPTDRPRRPALTEVLVTKVEKGLRKLGHAEEGAPAPGSASKS
ncbi:MAG: hypothetical protein Alpg2KO_26900 [Alphaproteobacteria bacterium]